jgi:hypothetical protein
MAHSNPTALTNINTEHQAQTASVISLLNRVSQLEQSILCNSPSVPIEQPNFPALPNSFTQPPEPIKPRLSVISSTASGLTSPTKPTEASQEPHYLHNLLSKFNELSEVWSKLEDDSMRQFFVKYALFEPQMNRKLDLNTNDLSLTMKQSVILTSYDQLQTAAAQFEEVQKLLPILDKQPLQNIEQFTNNIHKHSILLQQSAAYADKLNGQIEQFVTLYNQLIDHISRKFVNWDAQLKKWENSVDQLIAKRNQ